MASQQQITEKHSEISVDDLADSVSEININDNTSTINSEVSTLTIEADEEVFVEIKGYKNYYISNFGRVASTKRGFANYLMPGKDKDGYLQCVLSNDNKRKTFRVHRLVAEHFVDNPENKPQVDHIDRNKTNNKASNLRYCTQQENNFNTSASYKNTTGVKGVHVIKNSNCYRALIKLDGQNIYLGTFTNFKDAVNARKNAEQKLFGLFASK